MLVFSRYQNERIKIGDQIEVCVVAIRGDKVRLGVTAPRAITVDREEVYLAKQDQEDLSKVELPIQRTIFLNGSATTRKSTLVVYYTVDGDTILLHKAMDQQGIDFLHWLTDEEIKRAEMVALEQWTGEKLASFTNLRSV